MQVTGLSSRRPSTMYLLQSQTLCATQRRPRVRRRLHQAHSSHRCRHIHSPRSPTHNQRRLLRVRRRMPQASIPNSRSLNNNTPRKHPRLSSKACLSFISSLSLMLHSPTPSRSSTDAGRVSANGRHLKRQSANADPAASSMLALHSNIPLLIMSRIRRRSSRMCIKN